MLLANLGKSEHLKRILKLTRGRIPGTSSSHLSDSTNAMDQLMDCFVKGAEGGFNKNAYFDHLAYLFADLAKV